MWKYHWEICQEDPWRERRQLHLFSTYNIKNHYHREVLCHPRSRRGCSTGIQDADEHSLAQSVDIKDKQDSENQDRRGAELKVDDTIIQELSTPVTSSSVSDLWDERKKEDDINRKREYHENVNHTKDKEEGEEVDEREIGNSQANCLQTNNIKSSKDDVEGVQENTIISLVKEKDQPDYKRCNTEH